MSQNAYKDVNFWVHVRLRLREPRKSVLRLPRNLMSKHRFTDWRVRKQQISELYKSPLVTLDEC